MKISAFVFNAIMKLVINKFRHLLYFLNLHFSLLWALPLGEAVINPKNLSTIKNQP